MKKRRIPLIVFLLLLLGIGIYFLIRYLAFLNDKDPYKTFILPRLDETIIEIKSLTREKTVLNAKMLLNNPLPFKIGADSIAYEIFISDTSVVRTTHRQSITLKSNDTSWISIPITIENHKLEAILDRADKNGFDSVYYEVRGTFYSHVLNDKKFNFHYGRKLPLVYLPDLEITRVEIDSANFNRFKLLIHATFNNKNVFDIEWKDISFRFAVAGNPWIRGNRPGHMRIEADTSTEIIFPVTVSIEEVGETVFAILRKGKKINYNFEMEMKVVSDENMLKNSLLIIRSDGTIGEIIDLAKSPQPKSSKERHSRKS
jgi:LEA14-like dessication related protein